VTAAFVAVDGEFMVQGGFSLATGKREKKAKIYKIVINGFKI
jgi:hypothetical protein